MEKLKKLLSKLPEISAAQGSLMIIAGGYMIYMAFQMFRDTRSGVSSMSGAATRSGAAPRRASRSRRRGEDEARTSGIDQAGGQAARALIAGRGRRGRA